MARYILLLNEQLPSNTLIISVNYWKICVLYSLRRLYVSSLVDTTAVVASDGDEPLSVVSGRQQLDASHTCASKTVRCQPSTMPLFIFYKTYQDQMSSRVQEPSCCNHGWECVSARQKLFQRLELQQQQQLVGEGNQLTPVGWCQACGTMCVMQEQKEEKSYNRHLDTCLHLFPAPVFPCGLSLCQICGWSIRCVNGYHRHHLRHRHRCPMMSCRPTGRGCHVRNRPAIVASRCC